MLTFSAHWQQPRKFLGNCELAGCLHSPGVLEGCAPQDAVLAVKNFQLNVMESSMYILAFLSTNELSFLFAIMPIIFFFVAKPDLKNADVLPTR